jgi:hypothetical protein
MRLFNDELGAIPRPRFGDAGDVNLAIETDPDFATFMPNNMSAYWGNIAEGDVHFFFPLQFYLVQTQAAQTLARQIAHPDWKTQSIDDCATDLQ